MIVAAFITSFSYGQLLDNTHATVHPATADSKVIIGATGVSLDWLKISF
jgi:hypothetical protein